jgi:amino-acid N-acetyltransferase
MSDVPTIQGLINAYADKGEMLAVSLVDLYDRLRDFFVYEENSIILGVCALHFTWDGLAEVRSLAVLEAKKGSGIGSTLVKSCLEEAKEYDCGRVFTLTYVPDFFKKLGFNEIDKGELPHKVWADCVKCPKFPDCNEVPLAIDFT